MNPYFKSTDRKMELFAETKRWENAKYKHMGETTGGVDCTKLMALIFVRLGLLERIDANIYYGRDWYHFGDQEVMIQSFSSHLVRYLRDDLDWQLLHYKEKLQLMPGDVLAMAMTKSGLCNHTAMYLCEGKILHAVENVGVSIADFPGLDWGKRTKFVFRLVEKNQ